MPKEPVKPVMPRDGLHSDLDLTVVEFRGRVRGDLPRLVTRDSIGVVDEASLARLHRHSPQPKLCLQDWQYIRRWFRGRSGERVAAGLGRDDGLMPRYGTINSDYIASWFQREDPGGPMWALNLMQYRERAEYADGHETALTGAEADDVYAPHEHLAAVGSRIILVAPVMHHLRGDDRRWDRIAIAQYRDRMALIEMNSSEAFRGDEQHKDAAMEFTIVMATFPVEGDPVPPQESGADTDKLMLLHVVGEPDAPDLAAGLDATRIGRFSVEDRFIGDHRTFAESRFDLLSPGAAVELASREFVHDDSSYAVIADPTMDEVARSLTDPTRVLF